MWVVCPSKLHVWETLVIEHDTPSFKTLLQFVSSVLNVLTPVTLKQITRTQILNQLIIL